MAVPPPMTMAPDDKRAMRMRMRTLRRDFMMEGRHPRVDMPAFLREHIVPGTVVSFYMPVRFEADPWPIAEAAEALGAQLALPHTPDRDTPLRFLHWAPDDPLEVSILGHKQPSAEAPELAPDIILTPLLAFDAALHRLGQGGGHYDRAFALYPSALRIGIAWSVQQVAAVPVEPFDVPLHAVVTERGPIYHRAP